MSLPINKLILMSVEQKCLRSKGVDGQYHPKHNNGCSYWVRIIYHVCPNIRERSLRCIIRCIDSLIKHHMVCINLWRVQSVRSMWHSPPLHRRHNDDDSVSNHQPHVCLLNRLFRRRSRKTSKLRVTGLCAGNSPGPVSSPHKGPITRKMFPFDDVIVIVVTILF